MVSPCAAFQHWLFGELRTCMLLCMQAFLQQACSGTGACPVNMCLLPSVQDASPV